MTISNHFTPEQDFDYVWKKIESAYLIEELKQRAKETLADTKDKALAAQTVYGLFKGYTEKDGYNPTYHISVPQIHIHSSINLETIPWEQVVDKLLSMPRMKYMRFRFYNNNGRFSDYEYREVPWGTIDTQTWGVRQHYLVDRSRKTGYRNMKVEAIHLDWGEIDKTYILVFTNTGRRFAIGGMNEGSQNGQKLIERAFFTLNDFVKALDETVAEWIYIRSNSRDIKRYMDGVADYLFASDNKPEDVEALVKGYERNFSTNCLLAAIRENKRWKSILEVLEAEYQRLHEINPKTMFLPNVLVGVVERECRDLVAAIHEQYYGKYNIQVHQINWFLITRKIIESKKG